MIYTNEHNLPDRVIQQLNLTRKPEKGVLHITNLLSSPREYTLLLENWDSLTQDYSESLDALLGTALHQLQDMSAKKTNNVMSEISLEGKIGLFKIVGSADNYDKNTGILRDTKLRKVGAFMFPSFKEDLTKQLNCYAYLMELKGLDVKSLEADVYYRDWNYKDLERSQTKYAVMKKGRKTAVRLFNTEFEAIGYKKQIGGSDIYVEKREGSRYPELLIEHSVPIELWSKEVQKEWLEDTVELFTLDPMYCDENYRWKGDLKCKKYCSVRSICKYAMNLKEKKDD